MKRIPFCLLIILLAFLSPIAGYSQKVIDVTKLSHDEDIGSNVSLFKDKSRTLGIEEVENALFTMSQKSVVNLGYSNDNDWIKFKLYNPTPNSLNKILKINRMLISETELFYQINGNWSSVLAGAEVKKSNTPIQGLNIFLPFVLPSKDTTSFYLRVTSHDTKAIPMSIIDEEHVFVENSREFTILGVLIGAILIMTLYNLFLGISTRDSLYIHYALANIASVIGILGVKGYHTFYLPDHLIHITPIITPLSLGIWVVFFTNFSVRILELKKYSKRSYFLFVGVAILACLIIIVLTVLKASGEMITYQLLSPGVFLLCSTALYSGIIALKKGSRYAKFYLFAWGSFLLGVFVLAFTMFGVIPYNLVTWNGYAIGSVGELLIFSFALADRYNFLKKEKDRLKDKLVNTEGDLSLVISDNQMRHQFNTEVLENLESIVVSDTDDLRRQLRQYVNDIRLQSGLEEKKDFEQKNIQDMDIEFKKKLLAKYPELSTAEVEIFLLMRLNLSIKEMVRIRNSSESAIKSARHRIKKKTGLSPKEIINLTLE